MRQGLRRSVGYLAIFAIALHTILLAAVTPIAAANSVDPFSIICHSGAPAAEPADTTSKAPASTPSSACDHCNLCSATAASYDTLDDIVAGYLTPARLLQVLRPSDESGRYRVAGNPTQARGPPFTA